MMQFRIIRFISKGSNSPVFTDDLKSLISPGYPSNKKGLSLIDNPLLYMARPERFELPTAWFVGATIYFHYVNYQLDN